MRDEDPWATLRDADARRRWQEFRLPRPLIELVGYSGRRWEHALEARPGSGVAGAYVVALMAAWRVVHEALETASMMGLSDFGACGLARQALRSQLKAILAAVESSMGPPLTTGWHFVTAAREVLIELGMDAAVGPWSKGITAGFRRPPRDEDPWP